MKIDFAFLNILKNLFSVILILLENVQTATTNSPSIASNKPNCYVTIEGSGLWELLFHDEFSDAHLNRTHWSVEHETGKCHGNHIRQVSCNTKQNVRLDSGFLVLSARHEKYNQVDYTGARITSRINASTLTGGGRLEVRAAFPAGLHMRATIYSVQTKPEKYWGERGQLDLVSVDNGESHLYRGVHTGNHSGTGYRERDLRLDPIGSDLGQFHLYAAEWNEDEVRFSFDGEYDAEKGPVKLSLDHGLEGGFQIRFQLGVGLEHFQQPPVPMDFDRLRWTCPAFTIDYVRLYQRMIVDLKDSTKNNQKQKNANKLTQCKDLNNSDDSRLVQICEQSMEGNANFRNGSWGFGFGGPGGHRFRRPPPPGFFARFWIIILLVILLLLTFIVLIAYLVVQVKKISRKVQKPSDSQNLGQVSFPLAAGINKQTGAFNFDFQPNNPDDDGYIDVDLESYYEIADFGTGEAVGGCGGDGTKTSRKQGRKTSSLTRKSANANSTETAVAAAAAHQPLSGQPSINNEYVPIKPFKG